MQFNGSWSGGVVKSVTNKNFHGYCVPLFSVLDSTKNVLNRQVGITLKKNTKKLYFWNNFCLWQVTSILSLKWISCDAVREVDINRKDNQHQREHHGKSSIISSKSEAKMTLQIYIQSNSVKILTEQSFRGDDFFFYL